MSGRRARRRARFALVDGTPPAFPGPLHVGRPNVPRRREFLARLGRALDARWLTNHGPLVRELEERIATLLGVRHAVTVCNATLGLQAVLRALEVRGPVILPAFTFVATAHAAEWEGCPPAFCDVDPATHNADPASAERAAAGGAGAILGVHLWGQPCDTAALGRLGARLSIPVIHDAAHAFGCATDSAWIGGAGAAEVFSFHATKFLNSFEGGCVTTNDAGIAERLRRITNFGFTGYDRIEGLGVNGKMSEPAAAMALCGLDAMEDLVAANVATHGRYAAGLRGIPGLRLLEYPGTRRHNHQYVVIEVDAARFGMDRDALHALLWAENVRARRYFHPGLHRVPPYAGRPVAAGPLPVTERLAAEVLVLPAGAAPSARDVRRVCGVIGAAHSEAPRVAAALAARARAS